MQKCASTWPLRRKATPKTNSKMLGTVTDTANHTASQKPVITHPFRYYLFTGL
jgi:hypothetical protein